MIVMVLFHHHSSIYNEDWSKPAYGQVCSNPRYIYYWPPYVTKAIQNVGTGSKP